MYTVTTTAVAPEELTEAWDIAAAVGYAPGVEDFNRVEDPERQAAEIIREDGVTRTFSLEVEATDNGEYAITGYVWEDTQDGEHLDAGGDAIEGAADVLKLYNDLIVWAKAGEQN